ncbi:MAG: hypothetical protein ACREK8_10085 [Gemmatimonadales bacterium]
MPHDRDLDRDESLPLLLVNLVLRRRRLLLGLPLVVFVLVVALSYAFGVGYTSRSTFVPQAPASDANRFSALAAQFALIAGSPGNSESVDFYAQLLRSRELLAQAVQSVYLVPPAAGGVDSQQVTLVQLWRSPGPDSSARVRAAADRLNRQLDINTSREANTVTVITRAESPTLAVQLNRRLVDLVSEFNLHKRQSRAAAERQFTADRLADARRQLDSAEDAERRFLEGNREYQSSPQLRFEAARLERRVALRQEVAQALAQSYEQARIDEVRDTPVITLIDRPEYSIGRARNRWIDGIVWALVAELIALAVVLGMDYLDRQRAQDGPAYREFSSLLAASPLAPLMRRRTVEPRRDLP